MAHDNVLLPGVIRTGTLVSDNPQFPDMQVPIRVTEAGIEITISWKDEDPISRLWSDGVAYGDDLDKSQYLYEVPRNLWFYDVDGSVALLDCRTADMSRRMGGYGGGRGLIIADRAVMGAKLLTNYQQTYGLRTSIVGLRRWVGETSIETSSTRDKDSRYISESLNLKSPDDIRLEKRPLGYIHFSWSVSPKDDIYTIEDKAYVETRSSEPLSWQSAQHLHRAIQDLLRISYGENRDLTESLVLRSSNPIVTSNNEIATEEWLPITSGIQELHKPKYNRCLIPYEGLKKDSIQKWLSLYDQIPRAIDPIITSFTLDKATSEVRLLEVGSGLEALGYYMLKADGKNKKDASNVSFKNRLKLITENLEDILPFNVDDWIQQTTSAYNGIKHANRKRPDMIACLNSWLRAVLTFRCWIALKLGIDEDLLKALAEHDHMRGGYQLLWNEGKKQE